MSESLNLTYDESTGRLLKNAADKRGVSVAEFLLEAGRTQAKADLLTHADWKAIAQRNPPPAEWFAGDEEDLFTRESP